MNLSRLGIIDSEGEVSSVLIRFIFQIVVQGYNVVHRVERKLRYIIPLSFTAQKFSPGTEQTF
jgi:hypothetical protein